MRNLILILFIATGCGTAKVDEWDRDDHIAMENYRRDIHECRLTLHEMGYKELSRTMVDDCLGYKGYRDEFLTPRLYTGARGDKKN